MKTIPAAMRLIDFSADTTGTPDDLSSEIVPNLQMVEPERRADDPIDEAIEQARAQAREEAVAAHAEELTRLQEEFGQRLIAERAEWVEQQAELLAGQITDQFEKLGLDLTEKLYAHCRPVLAAIARNQAIADMVQILNEVVENSCGVEIHGPPDLTEKLRKQLSEKPFSVSCHAASTPDVSIKVADTLIETRLAAWLSDGPEMANE